MLQISLNRLICSTVIVLASNKCRKGCTKRNTYHPTSFPHESLIIGFPTYLSWLDSLNRAWWKKCALKQLNETFTVMLEWIMGFPIQRESDNSAVESLKPNRHLVNKLWQCQKAVCLFCLMKKSTAGTFSPSTNRIWLNNSSSSFASWDKIKIPVFTLADQDWIGLMICKNFSDEGCVGFDFIGSELDSDWKI